MKKGNFIAAACFAALAIYVIWEASGFPPGRAKVPGAAMFPTMLAVVMLIASVSLVITTLRMRPEENKRIEMFASANARAYITMGILIVYVAVMPLVGFVTTSSVLLFALIQWFGKYKVYVSAFAAVATTLAVYCAFNYGLNVPLSFGALL